MNEIASAAESSYIYVEDSDQVIDAFGGALGSQQGLAAKNIALNITAPPDSGIKLDEVNAGDYTVRIAAGSGSAEVKFSNLFSGEKRDVLVRMIVPASDNGDVLPNPAYPLFSLDATYTAIGAADTVQNTTADENCVSTVVRAADTPAEITRNVEVDAQMYRLKVSELLKQAMDMGDNNKVDDARKMLSDCVTEITTSSVSFAANHATTIQLIDDLNVAIRGLRNAQEYRSHGGRSLMTEAYSSNVQQRCAMSKGGKKSAYQTMSSDVMQTKSCNYKSSFK